jgi:hypothetical protein
MFWERKEKSKGVEMLPETPDSIIISYQPVARQWREPLKEIQNLMDIANAKMQNAELAQTGKLSRFSQLAMSLMGDENHRMTYVRDVLYGNINDLASPPNPREAEIYYMPVYDGIGTDIENVRILKTTKGTGKLIHLRFVEDADTRINIFHQKYVLDAPDDKGHAIYLTSDDRGLVRQLKRGKQYNSVEILALPLRDSSEISEAVNRARFI